MWSKPLLRPIQNHQLMSLLSFAKYACFLMMLWYPTTYEPFYQLHLHCCPFLKLGCFHDLLTQQYTILALIWTSCGMSSSLPSCWTYIHFSFHNPQVYEINLISCSTLSKLVRPLMVLSFNSPKPTKGLDALSCIFSVPVLQCSNAAPWEQ